MNPEWLQERINRYAIPDFTPLEGTNSETWERTHPLKCPHCGTTFFGFQPRDRPFSPYHNPEPSPGHGRRQVCGHPVCWDTEINHQVARQGHYAKACQSYYEAPVEETKATKVQSLRRLT